jgi:hypothetical protein
LRMAKREPLDKEAQMAKKKDPFDHDGDGRPGGSLPKSKRSDLKETIQEAREELAAERAVPRYNAEGVLLNPGDFNVSPEGLLTPKEK